MKHAFLLIAAALTVLCAAALVTTMAWFLAVIDLAFAGLLLFAAFRASRNTAITVPVIALGGSLLLALLLGGIEFEGSEGSVVAVVTRTTQSVLIFAGFVGNALVALFIALDQFIGLRREQRKSIPSA